MKEDQLRQHNQCDLCHKKLGETGTPLFWTLQVNRYGLDMAAIQRQQGLALMLNGNGLLAHHMGPNEDLAKPVMEPITLTVCEPCAMENRIFQVALEKSCEESSENE